LQRSEWNPDKIEMPEKGKNFLSFQNDHKQMKVSYVIYVDFEALVRKLRAVSVSKRDTQRRPKGMRHAGILTWL